jgi:hypothetical protein
MSPRQTGATPFVSLQFGATLNAPKSRPPHLPKFRDRLYLPVFFLPKPAKSMAVCRGGPLVGLMSVQVLNSRGHRRPFTHGHYGMRVGCSPRAFRFRRPFLVTLLDEQKSNNAKKIHNGVRMKVLTLKLVSSSEGMFPVLNRLPL